MTWTYLAVVPGSDIALRIAVTSPVSSTSGVQLGSTTRSLHLGHVQGTIHAAWQVRSIHIESELLVGQLDHLVVLLVRRQKVHSGAGDAAVAVVHVQGERASLGSDATGSVIVISLQDAVLRACLLVRARGGVGRAPPVSASLRSVVLLVDPVGSRIKHDG